MSSASSRCCRCGCNSPWGAAADSAWWSIAIALFIYGIGVGFATAHVTNVALADVPGPSAGQGSGIQSTARELGSALGIALLTTLFFSALGSGVRDRLTAAGLPDQQVEQFGAAITDSAGSAVPALAADPATEPIAAAGREAMSSAVELSSYLCAALLAAALLATLFMRPARATRPD